MINSKKESMDDYADVVAEVQISLKRKNLDPSAYDINSLIDYVQTTQDRQFVGQDIPSKVAELSDTELNKFSVLQESVNKVIEYIFENENIPSKFELAYTQVMNAIDDELTSGEYDSRIINSFLWEKPEDWLYEFIEEEYDIDPKTIPESVINNMMDSGAKMILDDDGYRSFARNEYDKDLAFRRQYKDR